MVTNRREPSQKSLLALPLKKNFVERGVITSNWLTEISAGTHVVSLWAPFYLISYDSSYPLMSVLRISRYEGKFTIDCNHAMLD